MFWLADLVLAIHFALAAFVASGLLLIPMGAICKWQWVRNRIFRTVHAGLMVFVAVEALIGMTCPLTTIEAYLRGTEAQESFLAHHLSRLLYWDLPLIPMGAICHWQWVRNRIFHSVSFCGYIWRALSGSCVYGGTVPPFPTKSINHISDGPLQHYLQNILFFNEKVSEPITGH